MLKHQKKHFQDLVFSMAVMMSDLKIHLYDDQSYLSEKLGIQVL